MRIVFRFSKMLIVNEGLRLENNKYSNNNNKKNKKTKNKNKKSKKNNTCPVVAKRRALATKLKYL